MLFWISLFLIISISYSWGQEYEIYSDILYKKANDEYTKTRCILDIYYPKEIKDYATVVWFHGGGLTSGTKFIPDELKNQGIAIVSVEYRLMPNVDLSECIDDAAAAVSWVFKNIKKYGGTTSKIIVAGHSAGGYLTNMIGFDKKWLYKYGIDADSIALLAPFSGHAISHFSYRSTKGMRVNQPSIDEYAPLYYVRADAPPIVIISGDRNLELYGRYEETAYFWRMLKENGHKNTYIYELDGYNHVEMMHPSFLILKKHIKLLYNDSN